MTYRELLQLGNLEVNDNNLSELSYYLSGSDLGEMCPDETIISEKNKPNETYPHIKPYEAFTKDDWMRAIELFVGIKPWENYFPCVRCGDILHRAKQHHIKYQKYICLKCLHEGTNNEISGEYDNARNEYGAFSYQGKEYALTKGIYPTEIAGKTRNESCWISWAVDTDGKKYYIYWSFRNDHGITSGQIYETDNLHLLPWKNAENVMEINET